MRPSLISGLDIQVSNGLFELLYFFINVIEAALYVAYCSSAIAAVGGAALLILSVHLAYPSLKLIQTPLVFAQAIAYGIIRMPYDTHSPQRRLDVTLSCDTN